MNVIDPRKIDLSLLAPKARKALEQEIREIEIAEERELCEDQLFCFLEHAWPSIDNSEFMSCFAIEAMCLPYETLITTNEGKKPIGEIVETGWQGQVLSYNHQTGTAEWQEITTRFSSGLETTFMLLKCADGMTLRLTANHPVFVEGRGYVRADQVQVGDKVLNSELVAGQELQAMWTCIPSMGGARASTPEGWLLQSSLLGGVKTKTGTENLSRLWWAKALGYKTLSGLLGRLTSYWPAVCLQSVWKVGLSFACSARTGISRTWGILQQEMLWVIFSYSRFSIPTNVFSYATNNQGTRQSLLFPLHRWNFSVGSTSCGSQSYEQPEVEPCHFVSSLPFETSSYSTQQNYKVGTAVIVTIKREVSLPKKIYNLEVVNNHNYFANGLLVHNCDHLEAVTLGHIKRLLINIPPRCCKTILCSVVYPAWTWARRKRSYLSGAQVKFLCASYGHQLSLQASNQSRRLLSSPWFQSRWPNQIIFREDQNAKHNYENDAGGARVATSVGGGLIGLGGDCLIADDLNNTEDVESEADRETVKDFWKEFHSTRLNNPNESAIIAIQQRLDVNDVSGLILEAIERDDEEWVHLCIPMEYDPSRSYVTVKLPQYEDDEPYDDPRTEEGELMWPERFNYQSVRNLERSLGPYMAAGRLQQLPFPKGGGIIQDVWWQNWSAEAHLYGLTWNPKQGGSKEFPQMELVVGSIDTAMKEDEENDFSAMTVWGVWLDRARNRRAMLMYAWDEHLMLHGKRPLQDSGEPDVVYRARVEKAFGLCEKVAQTCKRYRVQRLLIEDKTRGHDLKNEIKRLYAHENWGVEMVEPQKDKVTRTHSIVPLFTDNAIWAPNTKWADKVIKQCAQFPKGPHDDLHDTCLTGDTGIITSRGVIPIAEIKVGDQVLTHLGRWRPVIKTMRRISDHFYALKAKGFETIEITGNHPVRVMEVGYPKGGEKTILGYGWKPTQELVPRVELNSKLVRKLRRRTHDALTIPRICGSSIDKLDLADYWRGEVLFGTNQISKPFGSWNGVSKDDALAIIQLSGYLEQKEIAKIFGIKPSTVFMVINGYGGPLRENAKEVSSNRFVPLDYEAGWVFGLYAAEGSGNSACVRWSCDYKALVRVQRWIKRTFNRKQKIRPAEGCYGLTFSSILVSPLFADFGYGAKNKIVPQWALDAPLDFVRGFVEGFTYGDGTTRGNQSAMTSISKSLLWGLRLMLARLGIPSWFQVIKNSGDSCLSKNTIYVLSYTNPPSRFAAIGEHEIGTHIEKLELVHTDCLVYNLSVQGDESYVTVGGTVHNCTQFIKWARDNEILVLVQDEEMMRLEEAAYSQPQKSVAQLYGLQ